MGFYREPRDETHCLILRNASDREDGAYVATYVGVRMGPRSACYISSQSRMHIERQQGL